MTDATAAICEYPGCARRASANQGHRCRGHYLPGVLFTHPEPGPLETPCKIVDGTRHLTGIYRGDYGAVRVGGRSMAAHRWAWTVAHGPIPAGMSVLHRCDRPGCVALDHLFIGLAVDNVHDMFAKGRARPGSRPGQVSSTALALPPLPVGARDESAASEWGKVRT